MFYWNIFRKSNVMLLFSFFFKLNHILTVKELGFIIFRYASTKQAFKEFSNPRWLTLLDIRSWRSLCSVCDESINELRDGFYVILFFVFLLFVIVVFRLVISIVVVLIIDIGIDCRNHGWCLITNLNYVGRLQAGFVICNNKKRLKLELHVFIILKQKYVYKKRLITQYENKMTDII